MVALRSLAALPLLGVWCAVCDSLMGSFSRVLQGLQDLGRRQLGRGDARGDAQSVVRRAADRQPWTGGDGRAERARPLEVTDGVLRQRATPPLHMRVDGSHGESDRVGEVLARELDQLRVGA